MHRRQIVFSQGDPADAVFYIQKGKIELRMLSQRGKEAILAVLSVGDFFGDGCLAGQPLRMATAVAATECSVMRLEKSAMIQVLHDEPGFSALFIAYLLTRNIRIEEDLVDQLFNSSEERLVLQTIQKIHSAIWMCNTGSWLWGVGPWHSKYAWF